jgi:hypothetical protein
MSEVYDYSIIWNITTYCGNRKILCLVQKPFRNWYWLCLSIFAPPLWNHNHAHKSHPLVLIMIWIIPVLRLLLHFLVINCIFILISMFVSSKWCVQFHRPKFCNYFSIHPRLKHSCPSYSPWSAHVSNVKWAVRIMKLLMLQSFQTLCYFL